MTKTNCAPEGGKAEVAAISELAEAARGYASDGVKIFPCLAGSKVPATPHGFKDASSDPEQIDRWWGENPNYNIALCPEDMGWAIVDVEAGGLRDWEMERLKHTPFETFTNRTPGGGLHFIFEGSLPSRVKIQGLQIDTRGRGGYVLVAPSAVNGKHYVEELAVDLAPLPDWVAAMFSVTPRPPSPAKGEPVTSEQLVARLRCINPDCDYGMWRDTVAAIHATNLAGDEDGSERHKIAHEWSRGQLWSCAATKYDEAHVDLVFYGMPPKEGGVSFGTIDHHARQSGFTGPSAAPARGAEVFSKFAANGSRLVSRRGSELTPKKIEWTWPNRFPRGQLSLLAGHGNGGKTTMLLDMAARITRGDRWPDGSGVAKRGSVIYFSAEDATEQTLLPRFMAADGDRGKIHFVTAVKREDGNGVRSFHLQEDLRELEEKVAEVGDVELVVFDPISSYFGRTDTYRNSEVRSVLEPLAEFADRCGVTILGNTHFAKGSKATATMRILDSVAMSAVARACYVVVEDADDPDRRLFLPAKWNLTKRQQGLAFTIAEKLVAEDDIFGTHVVWESAGVAQTADEALGAMDAKDRPETAVDEAMVFVREYLAGGPQPTKEMDAAAKERSIALSTLGKAKRRLRLNYDKQGMDGGFTARLPSE